MRDVTPRGGCSSIGARACPAAPGSVASLLRAACRSVGAQGGALPGGGSPHLSTRFAGWPTDGDGSEAGNGDERSRQLPPDPRAPRVTAHARVEHRSALAHNSYVSESGLS